MLINFLKMHGLGNDYIYVFDTGLDCDWAKLTTVLSRPHFGIASDGLILISKSQVADFRMRIFNIDGSEAEMCGNGIRCTGKFLYDMGYTDCTNLTIETLGGIKKLQLTVHDKKVSSIKVEMGTVLVSEKQTLTVAGQKVTGYPVNVGNPHFVVFVDNVEKTDVAYLGPLLEKHPFFPNKTNVEFVEILNDTTIKIRVWERGVYETNACGTGATASAVAAITLGYTDPQNTTVCLRGGDLHISYNLETKEAIMTGSATTVFKGSFETKDFDTTA